MENETYLHLSIGQTPPAMEGHRPFRTVMVIEQSTDKEWQALIGEWLVGSGCLYFSAWGRDCESWHDSVDYANLPAFDFGEIPDDAFIMTTWHTDEPLREVFWFAAHSAFHPTVALDHTIIIHISAGERKEELLAAFRRTQNDNV